MAEYYHLNGELVSTDAATVSVLDRGFMYGDAAFETMRAYGGTVFEWEAHADRLDQTCQLLELDHGVDRSTLHERVSSTLGANDFQDAYIKLSISRGIQPGKLTPSSSVDPTVLVIVSGLPRGGVTGEPVWDGPARLETSTVNGIDDAAIPAEAKTHNYLNGILARLDVSEDADEALVTDHDGHVLEGATSNCFFVVDGTLKTPTTDLSILPGITRSVVMNLAADADIPIETGRYSPAELRHADELFLTNSTWELRPVTQFDQTSYSIGPVTEQLATAFDQLVEARYY